MDIRLTKIEIFQRLAEVNEESVLLKIKKILGIEEEESDDEFIKKYEANLKPMTKDELIRRSEKALRSFREGNYVDLVT